MNFLTTYALLYFFSQTENKPHHLSCHAEFIRYAKKNLSQTQKKEPEFYSFSQANVCQMTTLAPGFLLI